MRRIVVAGGGIAGVEAALTLAHGLRDADVTLLAHGRELWRTPDLVDAALEEPELRHDVPLADVVAGAPITVRCADLRHVDVDRRVAVTTDGELRYDELVVAPGARALPTQGLPLRTPAHATVLRGVLDARFELLRHPRERASVVIRAAADNAWAPPAYELAALIARRGRAHGLTVGRRLTVTIVSAELTPFGWFEPHVADIVVDELRSLGVELAVGVPESRFDDLPGDVTIDIGPLQARAVEGLPRLAASGWYEVDHAGRVHDHEFVVGDAVGTGFKAAFAAAWHARRVLSDLGGDPADLGAVVGGVPVDQVEYQARLGDRVLRVRIPAAASLVDPWLGHRSVVDLVDGPPDRLAGLLVADAMRSVRAAA